MSATATAEVPKRTTPRIRRGRSINAVADYFRRSLPVPVIYVEPRPFTGFRPDVLAVDRAGSGDFHVPEIQYGEVPIGTAQLNQHIRQLHSLPAHFRYLVLTDRIAAERVAQQKTLFAADEIGRVGVLLLNEPDLTVERIVPAERFRVAPNIVEKYERFLDKTKPDIYVRI